MFVVTGANGFIGSVLVKELNLNLQESEIICTDYIGLGERPGPLSHCQYSRFVDADEFLQQLTTDADLKNAKAFFHMGACSSTTELNEGYLKRINTDYTKTLFQFCAKNNIPFIYASSGATYGDGHLGFDDQHELCKKLQPLNPYGWSKLNFDNWALTEGLKNPPPRWYGLRFFNVYGPNEYHKDDMSSVVFKAYHQIQSSKKLKLFRSHNSNYQDGKQLRDFIYVKDIVRWMVEFYQLQNVQSGIYNMGTGVARTWLDLAENVFQQLNVPMQIDWIDIPSGLRERYQYYTQAKIEKLKSQGLSSPQWSLERGIGDYLKNYLLNPDPYI